MYHLVSQRDWILNALQRGIRHETDTPGHYSDPAAARFFRTRHDTLQQSIWAANWIVYYDR